MSQFIFNIYASEQSLFGSLGLDLKMLILQIIGFLVLIWLLAKFVFPTFNQIIERREQTIAEASAAADRAKEDALAAEERIAKEMKKARKEADKAIEAARKEASALLIASEEKAKKRAKHILDQANDNLTQDIQNAKTELKKQMKQLVADATETIIDQKLDTKADGQLIEKALDDMGRS